MLHPTLTAYARCFRNHSRQEFLDSFSDEAGLEHHDPVGAPARHSKEELGAWWDQMLGLFETADLTFGPAFPAGNEIALTFQVRARGKNGKDVSFDGIDVIELDTHGKILKLRAYWDAQPVLAIATS